MARGTEGRQRGCATEKTGAEVINGNLIRNWREVSQYIIP